MVAGERRASIRGWGGAVASRGIEAASARQRTMQTHSTRALYLPALLVLLTSAAATTFVLSRRGNLRRRPGPQMGGRRAADGRPITTTCPRRRIMAEWRRGSAAWETIPCVGQSRRRAGWTRAGRHAAATPARDYAVLQYHSARTSCRAAALQSLAGEKQTRQCFGFTSICKSPPSPPALLPTNKEQHTTTTSHAHVT